jgi:hypothetical protein
VRVDANPGGFGPGGRSNTGSSTSTPTVRQRSISRDARLQSPLLQPIAGGAGGSARTTNPSRRQAHNITQCAGFGGLWAEQADLQPHAVLIQPWDCSSTRYPTLASARRTGRQLLTVSILRTGAKSWRLTASGR